LEVVGQGLFDSATAPGIRISPGDGGVSETTRAFFGLATGSNQFMTGAASGDFLVRGNSTGNFLLGGGTTEYARFDTSGDFRLKNNMLYFSTNSGTWDGATIAGDQTLTGQVELTGQAASSDDSAMTRSLTRSDFLHQERVEISTDDWATTFTGTGNFTDYGSNGFRIGNVAGAGSTLARANSHGFLAFTGFTENANYIRWNRRFRVSFVCMAANQGADSIIRFQVGELRTDTTVKDLDRKGIGIKVEAGNVVALTHDGTTLTTSSTITTLDSNMTEFVIDSDGSGNVTFYKNGTLVHTATGTGPTGYSTLNCTAVNLSLDWDATDGLYINWYRKLKILIGE